MTATTHQPIERKRNLFAELMEGMDALQNERQGRVTLRTHTLELPEAKPAAEVRADELVALRKQLNLSRSVFARYLRTNARTLENWEQGRSRPNAQASLLIRLVEKFPDTVQRLQAI